VGYEPSRTSSPAQCGNGRSGCLERNQFGAVGAALVVLFFAIGLSRAANSEVLALIGDSVDPEDTRGPAITYALLLGAVMGIALLPLGFVYGPSAGGALLLLGLGLPTVIAQDTLRYHYARIGQPEKSLRIDVAFLLAMTVFLAITLCLPQRTPALLLASFPIASVASLAFASRSDLKGSWTLWTGIPTCLRWARRGGKVSTGLVGEFMLANVGYFIVALATPAMAGIAAAGSVRGVQALFSPATVMIYGTSFSVLPEFSRESLTRPRHRWRVALAVALSLSLVAGSCWVAWALVPSSLGQTLLGPSWAGAKVLLPPMGAAALSQAFTAGAAIGVRLSRQTSALVYARAAAMPTTLLAGLIGTAHWGVVGGTWGVALAGWTTAGAYWCALWRAGLKEPESQANEAIFDCDEPRESSALGGQTQFEPVGVGEWNSAATR
jgi:hypothetical protein